MVDGGDELLHRHGVAVHAKLNACVVELIRDGLERFVFGFAAVDEIKQLTRPVVEASGLGRTVEVTDLELDELRALFRSDEGSHGLASPLDTKWIC
ncbi:hypothetical protein [Hydrogenophilus hirschii]